MVIASQECGANKKLKTTGRYDGNWGVISTTYDFVESGGVVSAPRVDKAAGALDQKTAAPAAFLLTTIPQHFKNRAQSRSQFFIFNNNSHQRFF